MIDVLKLLEIPSLILAALVIGLLVKIIFRLLEINEHYAKAIQDLTAWFKSRFKNGAK